MPKELESRLRKQASSKGLTGQRAGRYIYGTLRKTGWKPDDEVRTRVLKGRLTRVRNTT